MYEFLQTGEVPCIVSDRRLTTSSRKTIIIRRLPGLTTIRPPAKRGHWIFSVNPHHYHWDTLFVKGKEMWRGAGTRADAKRQVKFARQGDPILWSHPLTERSLYALAEVTRDPYPDPHAKDGKNLVADLRALERLPRQVSLAELRTNPA